MYAVIESGGKQYRVAIGDRLKVESLKLDPGATLDLDKVLFLADGEDVQVGTPYVGSSVVAKVVGHGRGDKVRIFKLRRRKNSRQQAGHRQNYTELEITSIAGKTAEVKEKPAKVAETKEPAAEDASGEEKAKPAAKKASKKVTKKTGDKVTKKTGDGGAAKKTKKKAAAKKADTDEDTA